MNWLASAPNGTWQNTPLVTTMLDVRKHFLPKKARKNSRKSLHYQWESHDEMSEEENALGNGDDQYEFVSAHELYDAHTNMYGSIFVTYLATITIQGKLFDVIVDTGSSDTSVAASASCGCAVYYNDSSKCDGIDLSAVYGEGNWSGHACTDEILFGDLSLGQYTFAGMEKQVAMLDCNDIYHTQNGIVGLAYPPLLGPPQNYTVPFFDALSAYNNLYRVFAIQCCGWDDRDRRWFIGGDENIDNNTYDTIQFGSRVNEQNKEYSQGALDVGGISHDHFSGSIAWTPITREVYYSVDILDVKVGSVSVLPEYLSLKVNNSKSHLVDVVSAREHGDGLKEMPEYILDSGTSNIVLTSDLYDNLVETIKKQLPDDISQTLSKHFWNGRACLPHGSSIVPQFPNITFVFAGYGQQPPFEAKISPCRYLARAPASECANRISGHIFSIEREANYDQGGILGVVFFEAYYVIHDLENKRLGIAEITGCEDSVRCPSELIFLEDGINVHSFKSTPRLIAFEVSVDDDGGLFNVGYALLGSVSMIVLASAYFMFRCFNKRASYQHVPDLPRGYA